VADGLILPVIVADGSPDPAPTDVIAYLIDGAPKAVTGDCADIGSMLQLMQGARRAGWQPAFAGRALGAGTDCDGGDTRRFEMWFGADAAGEPIKPACGDYTFDGSLTVVPRGGGKVVEAESTFNVKVTGC
jgi:hypothetical protein